MPHTFSKFGISFLYPDNWTLDEQDAEGEAESATVYSPGGAFWSVSVHSPSSDPEDPCRGGGGGDAGGVPRVGAGVVLPTY